MEVYFWSYKINLNIRIAADSTEWKSKHKIVHGKRPTQGYTAGWQACGHKTKENQHVGITSLGITGLILGYLLLTHLAPNFYMCHSILRPDRQYEMTRLALGLSNQETAIFTLL